MRSLREIRPPHPQRTAAEVGETVAGLCIQAADANLQERNTLLPKTSQMASVVLSVTMYPVLVGRVHQSENV